MKREKNLRLASSERIIDMTNFVTRDGKMCRYKNDCGVIALCVMLADITGGKANYDAVAKKLINEGIYKDTGCSTGKYIRFVRTLLAPSARMQYWGDKTVTVSDYIGPRRNFTGVITAINDEGISHAMAVIDGVLFNADGYEDAELKFTLKIK